MDQAAESTMHRKQTWHGNRYRCRTGRKPPEAEYRVVILPRHLALDTNIRSWLDAKLWKRSEREIERARKLLWETHLARLPATRRRHAAMLEFLFANTRLKLPVAAFLESPSHDSLTSKQSG
jgi:hypothetical protein